MEKQLLTGAWKMRCVKETVWHEALVPGSVYADLMRDGTLPDPFYRENEKLFFERMQDDYLYTRTFQVDAGMLAHDRVVLCCDGLDTLCHVILNGVSVADTDNMHIAWRWDVKHLLQEGENTIEIRFDSPIRYCLSEYEKRPCWGSTDAIPGFGHLRKAHMMFGWDWGPRLPDAGIWKEIRLEGIDTARLTSVRVEQIHENGQVCLKLHPEIEGNAAQCEVRAQVTAPDGKVLAFHDLTCTICDPELWWPNGYGDQPLYTVSVTLFAQGKEQDTWQESVGLRTLWVSREKDEAGEEFCHIVNGIKIFAMGADYIPEDNIFSRITPDRTRRLLEDARLAHFNTIRVWGGGYYPHDAFYEICDELGLIVWQDLMYACSFYDLTPAFEASIRMETIQQVRRLRNHPSLALICGNNEMEGFMGAALHGLEGGKPWEHTRRSHVADYIKMFEKVLPEIVRAEAPQTFWWPSSPSSGGCFDDPSDPSRGDVHYWDVWHGEKPFTEYRKFHFRYVSEFGFQSFPCLETVETFTVPEDRNIFSRIMERHQRNKAANGKILAYLSQTFRYPASFDMLLYASQLLQAEAIRYGVEHWRRHRGECMGAIIWQLNDCWPVASWASIDSLGRWKALHYAAKRFFQPVMISIHEEGEITQNPQINEFYPEPIEKSAHMCVSNESMGPVAGRVTWALRDAKAQVIRGGECDVTVPPLSSVWLDKLLFPEAKLTENYFSCSFTVQGEIVSSSTALFCAPKHFRFQDPALTVQVEGDTVTVHASAFARQIRLTSEDPDLLLTDNFFDMNAGTRTVHVLRGSPAQMRAISVYDIG